MDFNFMLPVGYISLTDSEKICRDIFRSNIIITVKKRLSLTALSTDSASLHVNIWLRKERERGKRAHLLTISIR